jgi:branched-chain amino acid transport system substrate-binding protein
MKTNIIIGILLSLMVILSGCGGDITGDAVKEKAIKIGFIGPLTGDTALFGTSWRDGALLAVEEINAADGINGKKLELVSEDGFCKAKEATTAVQKLIDIDKVQAIVGGSCSAETLAAAPMADEAKVVMMSHSSTNPQITKSGDYIFRACPSDSLQGEIMADLMFSKGFRKVAVMYATSDYNIGLRDVFTKRFTELGGEIVISEAHEQDSKDVRTQITKVKAAKPEAIYLVPYPADGVIALKQIKELKLDVPLFAPEVLSSAQLITDAGKEATEGLIVSAPKFDESERKAEEFLQKFDERFGYKPEVPAFSANAYDIVYLFADAMKEGKMTGTEIKDFLYTVKGYDGAGGKLTIDENGDAIKDFSLSVVKDGEFIPLG